MNSNGIRIASKWLPWLFAVIFAAGTTAAVWATHIKDDRVHPQVARIEKVERDLERIWRVLCKIADANRIESADCP